MNSPMRMPQALKPHWVKVATNRQRLTALSKRSDQIRAADISQHTVDGDQHGVGPSGPDWSGANATTSPTRASSTGLGDPTRGAYGHEQTTSQVRQRRPGAPPAPQPRSNALTADGEGVRVARVGIMLVMLIAAAALGAVVAVLLVGTPTRTTSPDAAAPPPEARPAASPSSTPAPPPAQVGHTVSNGGITLTVTAARTVESIDMNQSNFRPGSGYETYTKTEPEQGGAFVVIETHIINYGQTSLDLTCSWPIDAKLVDDRDRKFDPIHELYKLKGNPECNKQLQPGFEDDMTYVFLVPADAKIVTWGFHDVTNPSGSSNFTQVRVDV